MSMAAEAYAQRHRGDQQQGYREHCKTEFPFHRYHSLVVSFIELGATWVCAPDNFTIPGSY